MRRLLVALLGLLYLPLLPLAARRNPLRLFVLLPLLEATFCALCGCRGGPDTSNEGW